MLEVILAQTAYREYEERVQRAVRYYHLEQGRTRKRDRVRLVLLGLSNWLLDLSTSLKDRAEMRAEWS
jgi:hypothetical protein